MDPVLDVFLNFPYYFVHTVILTAYLLFWTAIVYYGIKAIAGFFEWFEKIDERIKKFVRGGGA